MWSLISLGILVCYFLLCLKVERLSPWVCFFPDMSWNWSGKVAAIILWLVVLLALVKFKANFRIADAGFTFRQNENSIKPAFTVMCLFIILQIVVSLFGVVKLITI